MRVNGVELGIDWWCEVVIFVWWGIDCSGLDGWCVDGFMVLCVVSYYVVFLGDGLYVFFIDDGGLV